ncbi:Protein CBG21575 [Caenorhabditis briggsae]|uniref:Protein CBG21575 n=3 Tax=Caenorhabditis briggsae TaxID=6238 RepID=A8Y0E9_CAEBR|nr:Protein CBG21575 [Caenorhabditis briggsae]ULT93456.1 hypothetical protein L3Y34_003149 [Caenorhabditis briggsae]CAP38334.1 Protein CBG21575 [Caenorhabditis briggsae]
MGSFVLILCALVVVSNGIHVNTTGCGTSKVCIFRPRGCDPNLDCTIGVTLSVIGPNQMKVQMVAATIYPPVQQQYVAIAFSHDRAMGNDSVSECVISNMGEFVGYEPEVYVSYNKGKSNDRVFLNDDEHAELFTDLSGEVVDTRLVCEFTQQIMPQIDNKNGLIWNLNSPFHIMAATGSAQPDEVNAHELNRDSHSFPITSDEMINPVTFGNDFEHPTGFAPKINTNRIEKRVMRPTEAPKSSAFLIPLIPFVLSVFFF